MSDLYQHGSMSSLSSDESDARDLLTVFQAAPLAFFVNEEEYAIPTLDFESERELLIKTFEEAGADIRIDFEIAATDRLSAFLAQDKGRILHFSCHGEQRCLALEDGWGGLQALGVEELRNWVTKGGQNLQFVFVSACDSLLIGQAFVDAGVDHVVCCRQGDVRAEAAGRSGCSRWVASLDRGANSDLCVLFSGV